MDGEDQLLALLLLKKKVCTLTQLVDLENKKAKKRKYWVHPINQLRVQQGIYDNLIRELRLDTDSNRHFRYLRMTATNFDYLLTLLEHSITKQDTHLRKAIPPGLRLAVTLHHLSEGASMASIAAHYRLGRSTVSEIINDTCSAIWNVLHPIYLAPPQGPQQWKNIAEGYVKNYYNLLFEKRIF